MTRDNTPLTAREEMAMEVETAVKIAEVVSHGLSQTILRAAAAELRKTCATCKGFERITWGPKDRGTCRAWNKWVPDDGSGFCHRYESQPTGQAQEP